MSKETTGNMSGSDKKKGSLLGKFNTRFQDAVEQGRGEESVRQSVADKKREASVQADDIAMRNAQTLTLQRMMVPEGVVVEGAIKSRSETQIAGQVDGDVVVEARFALESTGLITGNVRTVACTIQGKIEGTLESTQDLVVGEKGCINSDAIAGKDMTIAGEINGNVHCGGRLRLMNSAKLNGNIRARSVVIDEGAVFNGVCNMAKPQQAKGDSTKETPAQTGQAQQKQVQQA